MTLKYDKKLDKQKKLSEQAEYYDNIELEDTFDFSKAVKNKGENKRVNMLLPFDVYQDAYKIGEFTGTGYQNTLKLAIAIGLKNLKDTVFPNLKQN